MEKSLKSIASNFGLYLGTALALMTIIAYAVKLDLFVNIWFGMSLVALMIIVGIMAVVKVKQAQNGFATFKEAFTAFFITILVAVCISTVVSFVLFNFIDAEAALTLKQITIEKSIVMLEGLNLPADAIDKTITELEEQNQYSVGNVLKSLAGNLVVMSIIGLIVAAAMKNNNPNAA